MAGKFTITENTEIELVQGTLTDDERGWLRHADVADIRGYQTETGEVKTLVINIKELSQIAFEYDLLRSVASRNEIDVLRFFRESGETTHTTAEISKATGHPKSSISRALSRLVEKNKLKKIQSGVYRYRG